MTSTQHLRMIRLPLFGLLVASLLTPATAAGQSPGASEISLDSAAVQQLGLVKHPDSWGANGTFGIQFQDGRTDTRGWDLDVILHRVTGGGTLFRLDAEWKRAEYEPPSESELVTVDDRRTVSLTTITDPDGFVPLIGIASWLQDVPVKLDHRIMAEVGPYIEFKLGPRLHLDLAPLIGAGVQDNHGSSESESIFSVGGLQSLTWHPTNTSTVQTFLKGHRNFDEADDHAIEFNTSLKSRVSEHMGLSIYYKLSVEGIHPDSQGAEQHTVGAGLSISFDSGGSGS